MSEWWTYRPSDFLMFSARSHYRLFELYNAALWPAQPIVIAVGVLWLAALAWAGGRQPATVWPQRIGCALLAAAWLWIAVAYHAQRFASINAAASGYAIAWGLQAMVLLALALLTRDSTRGSDGPGRGSMMRVDALARWAGLGLVAYAVGLHPWLGLWVGRSIGQAEVAGLAPDPTALATLGLLLLLPRAPDALQRGLRRVAWSIALAWCALSGLTLAGLGAPDFWLLPALGTLALCAAGRTTHRDSV